MNDQTMLLIGTSLSVGVVLTGAYLLHPGLCVMVAGVILGRMLFALAEEVDRREAEGISQQDPSP